MPYKVNFGEKEKKTLLDKKKKNFNLGCQIHGGVESSSMLQKHIQST